MRQTQLRSFYAVAKLGSFAKAEEHLHISQPTITKQIKDLEEQYQVLLFYRQRNNNRLTEVGRALYQYAAAIFSLEDRAKKLLISQGSLIYGTLNFGVVSPAAAMPLIESFYLKHPGIDIKVTTGGSSVIRQGLLNGDFDVGMLAYRDPHERLISLKLEEQPVVLVVPNSHPFAQRDSVLLKELEMVPVIHREQGSTTRTIFEKALIEQSIVLKSQIEVGSREGVRAASIHGLGISYVGAHELQPHERITAVSIADLQQTSKSYLVYSKDLEAVPIIQSMIACAEQHQLQLTQSVEL